MCLGAVGAFRMYKRRKIHVDFSASHFPHVWTSELYMRLSGNDAFHMYRCRASSYAGTKATSLMVCNMESEKIFKNIVISKRK